MCAKYYGEELPESEIDILKELEELIGKKPMFKIVGGSISMLNLSNNQLTTLPDSLGNLVNLKVLFLNDNHLTTLPDSIMDLVNLKRFNLSNNRLTALPDSIGDLVNLTYVNLNNNRLTALPDSIINLVNLIRLNLSTNRLTALPDLIGNLVNLIVLFLNDNQSTALPDSIGNLVNLPVLFLNGNQLTALPDSIGNLVNLTRLQSSDNQLTKLPISLGNLVNLTRLNLINNQLTALPDSIGNLVNLTRLNLNNNQLAGLPDSIGNLVKLKKENKPEKQLNFPLIFTYFPSKNISNNNTDKNLDRKSIENQKTQLSKLCNPDNLHYFWDYVIEKEFANDNPDKIKESKIYWNFKLFLKKDSDGVNSFSNAKFIGDSEENNSGENNVFKHPIRKNNFVEFQIILWCDNPSYIETMKLLSPLIRSITVTVETNRGDSIPVVFTDFYFKKYNRSQIPESMGNIDYEKEGEEETTILLQEIAYLKFDKGFIMEPYADLVFTDVKVEYEDSLIPLVMQSNPEIEKLRNQNILMKNQITEIKNQNAEIKQILLTQFNPSNPSANISNPFLVKKSLGFSYYQSPEDKQKIDELKKKEAEKKEKKKKIEKIVAIIEAFKIGYEEPPLPDTRIIIGRKISGNLGKYAEYLAAGVILMSAIPSFIQFLAGLRIDPTTSQLMNIDIPVIWELITYVPLAIMVLILTTKFINHQRISKNE